MKKKISLLLLILMVFLISLKSNFITILASPGLTCQLKNVGKTNPCPGSETCVFSLYQTTDSHAGDCSYGDYKICCEDPGYSLITTMRTTDCLPTEGEVIYLFQEQNSHAEYPRTNYNYRVCLNSTYNNITCVKRINNCDPSETGIISLKQDTNSHVANYSDSNYPIKICCNYSTPMVCGNGVKEGNEECDLPDWGDCEAYESCNATTCKCYDFRNETTECRYFDNCSAAPCTFGNIGWSNCYVNTTDINYIKFVNETLCPDATIVPHDKKTCPRP